MVSPSVLRTCAAGLILSPPKVKQLAAMIGQARKGGRSTGLAQLDFRGVRPSVPSPSRARGAKPSSLRQAALYASSVCARPSASMPSAWASAAGVSACTGGWSVRTDFCQLGTSSSRASAMAKAMPSVCAIMRRDAAS